MGNNLFGWNAIAGKLGFTQKNRNRRSRRNSYRRSLRIESLEDKRMLSITVDTFVDELDGSITDGDISLRDAIGQAIAGDVIEFDQSLNGQTISLLQNLEDIDITKTLTIDASMLSNGLTIQAHDPTPLQNNGDGFRIFDITGSSNIVTMEGLTLTGGDVFGNGGAIRSEGSLTIRLSTITGNSATGTGEFVQGDGGGVHVLTTNEATEVHIENSTIEDNHADEFTGRGGGVFL